MRTQASALSLSLSLWEYSSWFLNAPLLWLIPSAVNKKTQFLRINMCIVIFSQESMKVLCPHALIESANISYQQRKAIVQEIQPVKRILAPGKPDRKHILEPQQQYYSDPRKHLLQTGERISLGTLPAVL